MNEENDLDEYLLLFKKYADVAKWDKQTWVAQLSPLLTREAVKVYNALSKEEATDYECLKLTLLVIHRFTKRDIPLGTRKIGENALEVLRDVDFIVKMKFLNKDFTGNISMW